MTLADFTTCGKNIFPSPNKSPTVFIPFINGPSMTSIGLFANFLTSSTSSSIYSVIPLINAYSSLSSTTLSLHFKAFSLPFLFSKETCDAYSNNSSVALFFLFSNTSSTLSNNSFGISS